MGIEPTSLAWEAKVLPLYYTRALVPFCLYTLLATINHNSHVLAYTPVAIDFAASSKAKMV